MVAVRRRNKSMSLPNKGGLSLWGTERWRVRLWCLQVSGIQKIKEVGDEKVLTNHT
jgi:hypothetical protein